MLNSSEDVFDLPNVGSAHTIAPRFAQSLQANQRSVIRSLHKCFGVSYYLLGLVKLFGDLLALAGPLLLNILVEFIDNKSEPMLFGYLCAVALCLTNLSGALCSVHFNMAVAEVGLRARVALISAVYAKTLSVSSSDLSAFTSGEIVNLMSTDIDRIVNFCPSFHAFWSLPLQMALTVWMCTKNPKFCYKMIILIHFKFKYSNY